MTQTDWLAEHESAQDHGQRFELGRGYSLHLPRGPRGQADVYHHGSLSKRVDLRDKAARRLLVVELIQQGVNQTRLASALELSRQTLHNYHESYNSMFKFFLCTDGADIAQTRSANLGDVPNRYGS